MKYNIGRYIILSQSIYDIIKSRDIFLSRNFILLENSYKNNKTKMLCRCMICNKESYKTLDSVLKNKKCIHCYEDESRYKYEDIYNIFKTHNCELLEKEYKNRETPMKYRCECGRIAYIRFKSFQQGKRCYICGLYKISGEKNGNWDEFKVGKKLTDRLRRSFNEQSIKKLLHDDPNFENWKLNPAQYEVDHIIPVKAFAILVRDYNLDEVHVRFLINKRENIQLLTEKENREKGDKHNIMEDIEFLEIRGVFIERDLSE